MRLLNFILFHLQRIFFPARHEAFLYKCDNVVKALVDIGCHRYYEDGCVVLVCDWGPRGVVINHDPYSTDMAPLEAALRAVERMRTLLDSIDAIDYTNLIYSDDGGTITKPIYFHGESVLYDSNIMTAIEFLASNKRQLTELELAYRELYENTRYFSDTWDGAMFPAAFAAVTDLKFKEAYFAFMRDVAGLVVTPGQSVEPLQGRVVDLDDGNIGMIADGKLCCTGHGVFIPVRVNGIMASVGVNSCVLLSSELLARYNEWVDLFEGESSTLERDYSRASEYIKALGKNHIVRYEPVSMPMVTLYD